jgi:hypothetical protein
MTEIEIRNAFIRLYILDVLPREEIEKIIDNMDYDI